MDTMGRFAVLLALFCGCSYTAPATTDDDLPPDTKAPDPDGPPDSMVITPDSQEPDAPAEPQTTDHVAAADTWIQVNIANTNNGGEVFVIADGNPLCVSLLRFDLSGLANSTVSKVDLHIFTNFDIGAEVQIFDLNESWSESQATWNQRANGAAWMTAGAGAPSRDTTPIGTFTPATADSEFTVAIDAATIQDWIDDPNTNFGMAIASVNADGPKFHSREASNFKPFLRITHTP
jgi:hypothetical protein